MKTILNKRDFIGLLSLGMVTSFISNSFSFSEFPRKYHKIIKNYRIETNECIERWNNFIPYSKIELVQMNRDGVFNFNSDFNSEYILLTTEKGFPDLYINKNKYYEIENCQSKYLKENKSLEINFDILKYLGQTPKERIIMLFATKSLPTYAIGNTYYKEKHKNKYGISWVVHKYEVCGPITENMYSKAHLYCKYGKFEDKTYNEYLEEYKSKLIELSELNFIKS